MSDEIDGRMRELSALDPARDDPGYWLRFHRWVLTSAGAELARRRRRQATVGDVVLSWWRGLVPTAAVAAALGAFLLLRGDPPAPPVAYLNVDELLLEGMDAPVMPAFETADAEGGIVIVNEIF